MKKEKLRIVQLIIVIAVFCLFAIGSGSSGDAKKVGEVSNSNPTADKASKDTNKTEPTAAEKSTPEPQQTEFRVGDILQAEGLSVVYVASGEYHSDNQFLQPGDGNKYIFIELAVENTSKSDRSISAFSFDCYADGYDCESFYGGEDSLSATLSSGRTTNGKVYFEVPKDAQTIEIEYEYNILSDKKAIFIYEGEKDSGYVMEANTNASADAFKVGDVVEAKDFKITYLSCQGWQSENQFIAPKDGFEFIACEFEFENIGSSDRMVSAFEFKCYADGGSCDQTIYNDSNIGTVTLSAGRKAKGTVTFEVPTSATVVEVEYNTDLFASKHVIFTVK